MTESPVEAVISSIPVKIGNKDKTRHLIYDETLQLNLIYRNISPMNQILEREGK